MQILTEIEHVNGEVQAKEFVSREIQICYLTALFTLDPAARVTEDRYYAINESRIVKISLSKPIDL